MPLNYHERTSMVINPNENIPQQELDRFQNETRENNFVTNEKKTVVMVFNQSKKYAFAPEFKLGSSEVLTTHKELRILGVMVQEDLGWDAQVKFMIEKASNKIWLLRRMKQLGVDEPTITTSPNHGGLKNGI